MTKGRRTESPDPLGALYGRHVAAKLRSGAPVSDSQFDELYPLPVRAISVTHWTPVRVAFRAARLLVRGPRCRVLDVGSGVGKFSLVGALATEGHFFGIEQCESLVECARDAATLLGVPNVTFTHGPFHSMNPEDYDGFYFFNPFDMGKRLGQGQFDWPTPSEAERFEEDVLTAQAFLRAAKPGTRVVTYNGMGGSLPSCYEVVEREQIGCTIELALRSADTRCRAM